MGDWNEEARDHKIRRTAPLVDEFERPSAGPARSRSNRKNNRPWKIEWRTHPEQVRREKEQQGWWWRLWKKNRHWSNYGAYKTENARDQALSSLQRKNQTYWQYRKKDPK